MKFLRVYFTHCYTVLALCLREVWPHQTIPATGRVVGMAMWLTLFHLLLNLDGWVYFNLVLTKAYSTTHFSIQLFLQKQAERFQSSSESEIKTNIQIFIMAYLVMANNQLTINTKDAKRPSLGSRPESIIAFQDSRFYQCRRLVSCPKG